LVGFDLPIMLTSSRVHILRPSIQHIKLVVYFSARHRARSNVSIAP
jgi:hypothetical protein